jgi:transposase-like protein
MSKPVNIIERGRVFVESLRAMAGRTVWDWRRCPRCESDETQRYGSYVRYPWGLAGQEEVVVRRHLCLPCDSTYSEQSPWLVRGSWYKREVHRYSVDLWQHGGSSLRRVAEWVRSQIGRQERWQLWHPLAPEAPEGERCTLGASTVHRWLDGAGRKAQESVGEQLAGIASSGQMGTDGLWARLRGGSQRVVLALVDTVSGLIHPPVVVEEEESAGAWGVLFWRAREAGLDLDCLGGVTSDGAQGLLAYLRQALSWVRHQRCVWHLWRNLGTELARASARAAQGLAERLAQQARQQVRQELTALLHAIIDAPSYEQAEQALARLMAHAFGAGLGKKLNEQLDRLFMHQLPDHRGLVRVGPEWLWRDFRLRLSHGRNHGSAQHLERAVLRWAVYRNFTPAQSRSEVKRHYKHPGRSALEVAGASPGKISYLDALGV